MTEKNIDDIYRLLKRPLARRAGMSKARVARFRKLGVETDGDLLRLFPRAYEDWTNLRAIAELQDGEDEVFIARVTRAPALRRKGKLEHAAHRATR